MRTLAGACGPRTCSPVFVLHLKFVSLREFAHTLVHTLIFVFLRAFSRDEVRLTLILAAAGTSIRPGCQGLLLACLGHEIAATVIDFTAYNFPMTVLSHFGIATLTVRPFGRRAYYLSMAVLSNCGNDFSVNGRGRCAYYFTVFVRSDGCRAFPKFNCVSRCTYEIAIFVLDCGDFLGLAASGEAAAIDFSCHLPSLSVSGCKRNATCVFLVSHCAYEISVLVLNCLGSVPLAVKRACRDGSGLGIESRLSSVPFTVSSTGLDGARLWISSNRCVASFAVGRLCRRLCDVELRGSDLCCNS